MCQDADMVAQFRQYQFSHFCAHTLSLGYFYAALRLLQMTKLPDAATNTYVQAELAFARYGPCSILERRYEQKAIGNRWIR